MIFYNSILGLPVFDSTTNTKVASVIDILICSDWQMILGIIVEKNTIFGTYKYIPIDEIELINKTSIKIYSQNGVLQFNSKDDEYKIIKDNRCKINTSVYSQGQKIGVISDLLLNFRTSKVVGYVVSDGIVQDIIAGRKVFLNKNIEFRKRGMFVPKWIG